MELFTVIIKYCQRQTDSCGDNGFRDWVTLKVYHMDSIKNNWDTIFESPSRI